ncbi:YfcC family protein [Treponema sp. OMZ 840]|uniref:YfcC family protein n=1 Tax=Treponema sp. OMZ 840 TaxID=244313 RepID=UPI003D93F613
MEAKKKKIVVPHTLAIIVVVMFMASILTYIIPAGSYDRTKNEAGQTIVLPESFHYVDRTPVNPLSIFSHVFTGLNKAKNVIFVLLCAGGGMGVLLSTGMFQGIAGSACRKARGKNKEWLVISLLMSVFALLCIPINLNFFIPFASLGVLVALSLGLDAIVGVSIVMLGGAVGFSCGAMNISNTGTAQQIAELSLFSGMWFRLVSMIPFLLVSILYVLKYAKEIKKMPEKSVIYNVKIDFAFEENDETRFIKRHIPVAVVALIGIGYIIYVSIFGKLSNEIVATTFIYMGFAAGLVYRMPINTICKEFMNGVKSMAATSMMIGFAYVIGVILTKGNVIDTVVHGLANVLSYVPNILKAPAMFIMHIIINLFITSGSGQAAVSMPIFVPVADLVGISRQTAVLAFNFGDGFCNNILPHAAATMGFVGAIGIPFTKWFKYAIKLFVVWVIVGIILLMIASLINYV